MKLIYLLILLTKELLGWYLHVRGKYKRKKNGALHDNKNTDKNIQRKT